jgi:hypothetical protein
MKLSQWHKASTPPVNVGLYEVKEETEINLWLGGDVLRFSYFNGHIFNGRWETLESAYANKDFGRGCSVTNWRGIVK